jgi:predicted nucleic acid-binding protein
LSRFVLDVSVALSWCFDDEASTYAELILDLLADGAEAQAPAIWPFEVCNSLLMAERKKRISEAESIRLLNRISALPIVIGAPSNLGETGAVFAIARQSELTIYEAVYLELARRSDLPLATIDRKLAAAAHKSGIPTAFTAR